MQWAKIRTVLNVILAFLIPTLAFLLGIVIGPVGLWQCSMERSLEPVTPEHIVKLTHDIDEIIFSAIELSNKYIEADNAYKRLKNYLDSRKDEEEVKDPEVKEKYLHLRKLEIKLTDLDKKLGFLINDYNVLETELALLENREPRELPIDLALHNARKAFSISEMPKMAHGKAQSLHIRPTIDDWTREKLGKNH